MLSQRVLSYIQEHHLLVPGERVVVGVSGGPDSVCLLYLLHELASCLNITLHAAHLNHAIRGKDAEEDAEFVAALCRDLNIACSSERIDVPALAQDLHLSIEEAGRFARYAHLARTALEHQAGVIAVGHNADDQVETILMHFLRGAGLAGLRGMQPVGPLPEITRRSLPSAQDIRLVRPLLEVTRQEIEAYCAEHRLAVRQDVTNLDNTLFRNRLRHELLPILEEYNPNIRAVLRRTSKVVSADVELLEQLVGQHWDATVIREDAQAIIFDIARLRAESRAMQRSLLRRGVLTLNSTLRDISFAQVENALNIVNKGIAGKVAELPGGITLHIAYHQAILTSRDSLPHGTSWPCYSLQQPAEISVPGVYTNRQDGWCLECRLIQRAMVKTFDTNPYHIYLDGKAISGKLSIGTRQPGDRLQPLGMHGQSQKLHDLMINAKIPSFQRSYIPVLRQDDQIVWVVGLRQDSRFAARDDTQVVISVHIKPLEGC